MQRIHVSRSGPARPGSARLGRAGEIVRLAAPFAGARPTDARDSSSAPAVRRSIATFARRRYASWCAQVDVGETAICGKCVMACLAIAEMFQLRRLSGVAPPTPASTRRRRCADYPIRQRLLIPASPAYRSPDRGELAERPGAPGFGAKRTAHTIRAVRPRRRAIAGSTRRATAPTRAPLVQHLVPRVSAPTPPRAARRQRAAARSARPSAGPAPPVGLPPSSNEPTRSYRPHPAARAWRPSRFRRTCGQATDKKRRSSTRQTRRVRPDALTTREGAGHVLDRPGLAQPFDEGTQRGSRTDSPAIFARHRHLSVAAAHRCKGHPPRARPRPLNFSAPAPLRRCLQIRLSSDR